MTVLPLRCDTPAVFTADSAALPFGRHYDRVTGPCGVLERADGHFPVSLRTQLFALARRIGAYRHVVAVGHETVGKGLPDDTRADDPDSCCS